MTRLLSAAVGAALLALALPLPAGAQNVSIRPFYQFPSTVPVATGGVRRVDIYTVQPLVMSPVVQQRITYPDLSTVRLRRSLASGRPADDEIVSAR